MNADDCRKGRGKECREIKVNPSESRLLKIC